MADSTTHDSHLVSWNSAETLSFGELPELCCGHCKKLIVPAEQQTELQQAIQATIGGKPFVFKSIVLLTCEDCMNLVHLHCYSNQNHLRIEDLLALIENIPVKCFECN